MVGNILTRIFKKKMKFFYKFHYLSENSVIAPLLGLKHAICLKITAGIAR